jgi:two-component sensor histidine kinase
VIAIDRRQGDRFSGAVIIEVTSINPLLSLIMTTAASNLCARCLEDFRLEEFGPSAMVSLTAARVGLWEWEPRNEVLRCCARARSICGLTADEPLTLDRLLARIHPEDRQIVAGGLRQMFVDGGRRRFECRTMDGEAEQWISMTGRRCSLSGVVPAIAGVVSDITESKRHAVHRDLLVRELSHRINNIFAVLSATLHVSSRAANTAKELSTELQSRLSSLAIACSVPSESREKVALQSIVERELAPFSELARIMVSGEPTWLAQWPAMSMTLILHELATNAMKYGALGREDGELSVRWWSQRDRRTSCIVLHWKEHSREGIIKPGRTGLGSSLMAMAARNVDGNIRVEFQPDGLAATIVLPRERLPDVSGSPSNREYTP